MNSQPHLCSHKPESFSHPAPCSSPPPPHLLIIPCPPHCQPLSLSSLFAWLCLYLHLSFSASLSLAFSFFVSFCLCSSLSISLSPSFLAFIFFSFLPFFFFPLSFSLSPSFLPFCPSFHLSSLLSLSIFLPPSLFLSSSI